MKTLIKKILRETSNKKEKLKSELLNIGVQDAKRFGVTPTDYINIVFDGDVVSYVSHFLNPLLHLDKSGRLYMYNGYGPFQGTVFEYHVRKLFYQNVRRVLFIPKKKYDYIMKFMDEETLTEFLNEYYELYFDKIVPQKEVNFG
jgi:hypothetical protein